MKAMMSLMTAMPCHPMPCLLEVTTSPEVCLGPRSVDGLDSLEVVYKGRARTFRFSAFPWPVPLRNLKLNLSKNLSIALAHAGKLAGELPVSPLPLYFFTKEPVL